MALGEGINFKEEDDLEGVFAFAQALINGSMFVVQANLRPAPTPSGLGPASSMPW
jgi:hypothetical protein